jgi:metal-dependent amidase/aminoacylase/carboxypeptidase family protein
MPARPPTSSPTTASCTGTVRTFTLEVLDLIEQRMKQIAEHICAAHDATCDFEFVRNYPPTVNTEPPKPTSRASVMAGIVGETTCSRRSPP